MEKCYLCKGGKGEFYCTCDRFLCICRLCCKMHKEMPGNHCLVNVRDFNENQKFCEANKAANTLEQVKIGLIEEGKEITCKIFSAIDKCLIVLDNRINKIAELIKNNLPFDEFEENIQKFLMENNILAFKNTLKESLLSHFNHDNIKEKTLVYDELKLITAEITKGNKILEKMMKCDKKPEIDEKMQKIEEKIEYFTKEITKIKQFTQENIEKRMEAEIKTLKDELGELENAGSSEITELKEYFSEFAKKTENKFDKVLKN